MDFVVRCYLGTVLIKPSELSTLIIASPAVDRIVNDIVDRGAISIVTADDHICQKENEA